MELAVDILAIRLDVEMQRQRLVGIVGQLWGPKDEGPRFLHAHWLHELEQVTAHVQGRTLHSVQVLALEGHICLVVHGDHQGLGSRNWGQLSSMWARMMPSSGLGEASRHSW